LDEIGNRLCARQIACNRVDWHCQFDCGGGGGDRSDWRGIRSERFESSCCLTGFSCHVGVVLIVIGHVGLELVEQTGDIV
jgi:hypothetical protein